MFLTTHTGLKVALIVLNQPLDDVYPHLVKLWECSVLKAAADGGTNRLCEFRTGSQLRLVIPSGFIVTRNWPLNMLKKDPVGGESSMILLELLSLSFLSWRHGAKIKICCRFGVKNIGMLRTQCQQ